MQAIILAAGMGKRLKELTKNNTKCMVEVNGVTLIERLLRQIEGRGLSRVVIVVGYEGQKLMDYIGTLGVETPIVYIENPVYNKTNNIYSLALARDWLCREDTLLFESDLIFEDALIDLLLDDPRETLALVDKYESWMDGTCVKLTEGDKIAAFIPGRSFDYAEADEYYKTVNIYKFSRDFSRKYYVPFLEAYQKALGENEYYEQVLRVLTMLDEPVIEAKRLSGQRWYEIDDIQDLDIAESIFLEDGEERVARLQGRYGGYWRYPRLLDFCYLVNPWFPPERLVEEMKASFRTLLTQYPSGMRVNALLAANCFDTAAEQTVVGNGAAELIKALMERLPGRLGLVRPTFEEYGNRRAAETLEVFRPDNPDCAYGPDELIAYFGEREISALLLINPDNPSGNYIPREGLLRLLAWAEEKGIRLVVDESFADFAEEEGNSLLSAAFLREHPGLIVVKSISKSYGVPGLRLGVLASGDRALVDALKKDVAIWNLNSFAEFFLQIAGKYKRDYAAALAKFRAERGRFVARLAALPGLRVVPTQANYVMAELSGMSARELMRRLVTEDEILIKDLTPKMNGKNYVRLAVKTSEENDRLLAALERLLS